MHIEKTKIKDLIILRSEIHKDNRGFFKEINKKKILKKDLIFDCLSRSKKNTIRGLHFQKKNPQGKFITVVEGEILDVAVDLRKNSKTFGKSFKIVLSEKNCKSVFIPPGFAHGFQSLEKENIVCYSCTEYRSIGNEHALLYNDPFFKIKWPKQKPLITLKDKNAKKFKDFFNL